MVMLTGIKDDATSRDLAEKILQRLAQPYSVGANAIMLESSAGIALNPSDGMALEIVMRHADAAMYRDKNRRKQSNVNSRIAKFWQVAGSCE